MNPNPNEHREPLNLFDSRGIFCVPSERDLEALSESERRDFDAVHRSYQDVARLEKQLFVAGRNLHDKVAELRDAERALATIPKPTQIDLVRAMARQTAGLE